MLPTQVGDHKNPKYTFCGEFYWNVLQESYKHDFTVKSLLQNYQRIFLIKNSLQKQTFHVVKTNKMEPFTNRLMQPPIFCLRKSTRGTLRRKRYEITMAASVRQVTHLCLLHSALPHTGHICFSSFRSSVSL